jgi:flagellar secretion chaperone FliS
MSFPVPTYAPAPTARTQPFAPRGPASPGGGASPFAAQAARYRDAELLTATPGQLVVLLYDKMLLTLRRARVACETRHIEERCELLLKAADMITELRVTLDHEHGGAISTQLDALYAFMLRELYDANRRQDAAKIDVVLRIAGELRDAFAAVVSGQAAALPTARSA